MNNSTSSPQRRISTRLSIAAGNTYQIAGLVSAYLSLALARSTYSKSAAMVLVISAWLLLYFCCHAIAHWAIGSILGIRFAFYTIGGTGNPAGYPAFLRWLFQRLPFFGVQTEKSSMQRASPRVKAIMWSAGVTSSAVVPALCALYSWRARIPGGTPFLVFAVFWAIGTLSSNWRSQSGDYAKARRALRSEKSRVEESRV